MSESPSNLPSPPPAGPNNVAIYALCLVIGAVLGTLVTFLVVGRGNLGGSAGDPVVAEYGGKDVKASEAFGNNKSRLFELEEELYRTKEQAINEYIDNKLLETEAAKQKMPIEQLLDKETGGVTPDVTDKEIEDFLTSKGLSLNDQRIRKDDVREYLKYRKKFDKRSTFVAKLRESSKVKIHLKEPESPKLSVNTENFPSWGNSKAPVTIAIFSDFQCPFCGKAAPTVERVKKEYGPDKVRFVFIDMPLPNHPRANPAANAAHCANEQGKFWEMHDTLFANQTKLEDADLKAHAKTVGLDQAKFDQCFDSKKYNGEVDRGRKEAEKAGIQATPSFVINGTLLQGAQPFERFKAVIDKAK